MDRTFDCVISEEFKTLTLDKMLGARPTQVVSKGVPKIVASMPRLYLMDDSWLSVQAGPWLYSRPAAASDSYTHVEVMSEIELPPDIFAKYGDPAPEVYSYVPLKELMLYIASCGGIDREKTFDISKEFPG
jgi:hypothetical protein